MKLVWDEAKNIANRRKHGISFEEAGKVLTSGVECLEVFDELHSDDEDRFITIGPVASGLVLVVWTEIQDDVVRVMSARRATKRERDHYRAFLRG